MPFHHSSFQLRSFQTHLILANIITIILGDVVVVILIAAVVLVLLFSLRALLFNSLHQHQECQLACMCRLVQRGTHEVIWVQSYCQRIQLFQRIIIFVRLTIFLLVLLLWIWKISTLMRCLQREAESFRYWNTFSLESML